MKLKVTKDLSNSVYSARFELTDLTTFDQELLEDKAGSVFLDVGSDITKTVLGETTVLLKQSPKYVPFASALPVEMAWSILQYGDAKAKEIAENAVLIMEKRIVDIVTTLKTNIDDFSGVSETILTP